jgi:ABC-type multidrug transport system fused ATPase/permease subunit
MINFKEKINKIKESPLYACSKLSLDFIEKDKLFKLIFSIVCIIMAVCTIIHPLIILGRVISSGYFNFGVKYVSVFILTWLTIAAACFIGSHLWWNRRKKTAEFGSSEFIAIPFFAEIIRTLGEWLGILYAIIGFAGGLFTLIFLGRYSGGMLSAVLFGKDLNVNIGEGGEGPLGSILGGLSDSLNSTRSLILSGAVILGPVAGIIIIFVSRFLSERLKVLAAIANNTKRNIPQT